MKGLRSDAEGSGGAVLDVAGTARADAATGFAVVGTQAEPGGEVLFRGEGSHVGAALGDEGLGGEGVDALDLADVDSGDAGELSAQVEVGLVLAPLLGRGGHGGLLRRRAHLAEALLEDAVAGGELLLEEVVGFEGLLEGKHMFLAVGPFEGPGDVLLARLDTSVPQASQGVAVALTGDDRAQDAHAGLARQVADRLVQLHVHLLERLVHELDLPRAGLDDPLAVPPVRAQGGDVLGRPEGPGQESVAVKLLAPLAVIHVRLTAVHASGLPPIEEERLDAGVLEYLVNRHPVHPRRLHRHRVHPARLEPRRHLPELRRRAPEAPDRRCASFFWYSHDMLSRADVHGRRVGTDERKRRIQVSLRASLLLSHGLLLAPSRGAAGPRRRARQTTLLNGMPRRADNTPPLTKLAISKPREPNSEAGTRHHWVRGSLPSVLPRRILEEPSFFAQGDRRSAGRDSE